MKQIKLKTNESQLIAMAVQGQVVPPRFYGWEISHQGQALALPSVGGIVYNVRLGDPVFGWVADHIEPGVSATAGGDKPKDNPNAAFNALACVGNPVRVISGQAKGAAGVVTGHHGGVEHVIIDFASEVLEQLTYDDKLLIRAHGLGLKLLDYPDISLLALDPQLLHALNLTPSRDGLNVPVAAIIPATLMGSGLGSGTPFKGDFDIQTSAPQLLKKHGLLDLRLGDIVAIADYQCHYGYAFVEGAMTIGVVVHGDSYLAGHGPGVQALMTTHLPGLKPQLTAAANIGAYLGLGRWCRAVKKRK